MSNMCIYMAKVKGD